MKVAFLPTLEDIVAASRVRPPPAPSVDRVRLRRRLVILAMVCVGGLAATLSSLYLLLYQNLVLEFPFLLLIAYWIVFVLSLVASNKKRAWPRNFLADPRGADPISVEIDDTGFRWATPTWTCRCEWGAMRQFYDAGSRLMFRDDEPVIYWIPNRAFETPETRAEFCRLAQQYMDASRAAALPEH